MIDPFPLAGERVAVRRFVPDDLEPFQRYRKDPVVGLFQGWRPMPDAEAASFIAAMRDAPAFQNGEWLQVAIVEQPRGHLVGDLGLHLSADGTAGEIGFSLDRTAQGRGLATEAVQLAIASFFAHTAVAHVIGVTDARNVASIRLLERIGMKRLKTQEAIFRGDPCVEHTYSVARRQWEGSSRRR
jgi:RimJ/RimL family protein N-acetyltransferase